MLKNKNMLNYLKGQNLRYFETNQLQVIFFSSNSAGNNVIVYDNVLNSKTKILRDNKNP